MGKSKGKGKKDKKLTLKETDLSSVIQVLGQRIDGLETRRAELENQLWASEKVVDQVIDRLVENAGGSRGDRALVEAIAAGELEEWNRQGWGEDADEYVASTQLFSTVEDVPGIRERLRDALLEGDDVEVIESEAEREVGESKSGEQAVEEGVTRLLGEGKEEAKSEEG
jgi:hypothetical protein